MESKPRVLFVLHLPPPVHGAAVVGQSIRDSRVVHESFDCGFVNLTTASSLKDVGRFGGRKVARYVALLWRLRTEVRHSPPRLVYVTPNASGGAFYKDFVVVELLKSLGCRVVVHYHNRGVATRQDRWLDDRLYRRFFRGVKVMLLSEVLYDDVRKYVARKDVYICPNGV